MKLFYAPQSPFARKVRATAIELSLEDQIQLEYAEVVPGLPNKLFGLQVNPLRKVPALQTDAGEIIYDSSVICEYLIDLAADDRLIPPNGPLRWHVLTRHALAQGMCDAIISIRYETWLRPPEKQWSEWTKDQWEKINAGLSWFENCGVELMSPIDISHIGLGCLLGYLEFRWPESQWRKEHPALAGWYTELSARPSFTKTRPAAPESIRG